MYYDPKIIAFFKEHNLYNEEMFNYFKQNSEMIDYQNEEEREGIRCNFIIQKGILKKIILYLPCVEDNKTLLISIHEIIHAITAYPYLYKKINDRVRLELKDESLPLLYETIFINEVGDKNLKNYQEYLNSKIDKTSPKEYQIAIKICDKLYNNYAYDFNKIKKLSKKLTKKEHKN